MESDSNNKPVVIVHTLTGVEREEYLKEMHEKAMHDRTNELNAAWRKGEANIVNRMRKSGMSEEQIQKILEP